MFLLIIFILEKEIFWVDFEKLGYDCFFLDIIIYVICFVNGLFENYVLWMFFLIYLGFFVLKVCLFVILYFL